MLGQLIDSWISNARNALWPQDTRVAEEWLRLALNHAHVSRCTEILIRTTPDIPQIHAQFSTPAEDSAEATPKPERRVAPLRPQIRPLDPIERAALEEVIRGWSKITPIGGRPLKSQDLKRRPVDYMHFYFESDLRTTLSVHVQMGKDPDIVRIDLILEDRGPVVQAQLTPAPIS